MLDFVNTFRLLETRGIILHILDAPGDPATANGRAMLQMLCVFAEWESRVKSERVKAAMVILRQQGRHTGGKPPWGYKVVGPRRNRESGTPGNRRLIPDWEERALMLEVARVYFVKHSWEAAAARLRGMQREALRERGLRDLSAFHTGGWQKSQNVSNCPPIFRRQWSWETCKRALECLVRIVGVEGGRWIGDPELRKRLEEAK